MKSNFKKLVSLVSVFVVLSALLSIGVSAVPLTPSYQKLLYETNTFAQMRASTPYYTDVGTITDGDQTKNCRGLQMRDVQGGYVNANGWVTGLAGTHVEVYIDGMSTTGNINPDANHECNMESDCSTYYSCNGTLQRATSYFRINYTCNVRNSGHTVNGDYDYWKDYIAF